MVDRSESLLKERKRNKQKMVVENGFFFIGIQQIDDKLVQIGYIVCTYKGCSMMDRMG